MALLSGIKKFTHEACRYRMGSAQENCGNCHHYTGQGCEIVEDPIRPEMLCDFHAPGQGGLLAGGMMGNGPAY